ncbi:MAG: glycosyltransferase family 1 protein [Ruminococcaceae bacterium]|nr:glycosyltransferase family 1 protein [Oscillospiraceae bacterium]
MSNPNTTKKIKVLIVCTVPSHINGITNVIFNILQHCDFSKFEFGYVSINLPHPRYQNLLKELNIKHFTIPRKISNPLSYISDLSKIAKEYDIIHVHGNSATMVLEMLAARIGQVRIRIAHSHNTTCNMRLLDWFFRPLFYKLCNTRMACSEDAGQWLFRHRNFTILKNGINTESFVYDSQKRRSIRDAFNISNEVLIGHIGNFIPQKNHSLLIQIFHDYHKINPHSKLMLIGEGELMGNIKELVRNLNISTDVIFTGSVPNAADYLSAIDLILMPSLYEGFPLTMIEAQANGLRIVASSTISESSNITDLVSFVPINAHTDQWVNTMSSLISNDNSREETSQTAISKIKNCGFDIKQVTDTLMQIYKTKTCH